ncbi:hypothetical protein AAH446_16035 [Erwinia sp. P6884]|uniref:hypothetical protein n=1 Tax=Erwinia sp. P6884 TaxID=3141450 RepID=UPI00318488E4
MDKFELLRRSIVIIPDAEIKKEISKLRSAFHRITKAPSTYTEGGDAGFFGGSFYETSSVSAVTKQPACASFSFVFTVLNSSDSPLYNFTVPMQIRKASSGNEVSVSGMDYRNTNDKEYEYSIIDDIVSFALKQC